MAQVCLQELALRTNTANRLAEGQSGLSAVLAAQETAMELTKDSYTITRQTLEKVLAALGNNWFGFNGEDEYNNDDIIEAEELLKAEIGQQEAANS